MSDQIMIHKSVGFTEFQGRTGKGSKDDKAPPCILHKGQTYKVLDNPEKELQFSYDEQGNPTPNGVPKFMADRWKEAGIASDTTKEGIQAAVNRIKVEEEQVAKAKKELNG